MRRISRSRMFLAIAVVIGAAMPEMATSASGRRSAVAYFSEPTLVGTAFIMGPVEITHDDARMARGEPCTVIRLFDPAKNRSTETVATFHCQPRRGAVVRRLTVTTRPSTLGFGCELASYQFADDTEIHDLPPAAAAH